MKIIIYLLLHIVIAAAKTTPKATTAPVCEGIEVNGKLHKKHILMNGLNRPYHLAIYNNERVFFSYNVGEDNTDTFAIGYVNINEEILREVEGVKNGFALAIDHHSKTIYYGGSEGIFTANLTNMETLTYILEKFNIWDLFYHKNHLYFIDFPSQSLHKYDTIEKKIIPHGHVQLKFFQIAIDGEDDIFVTTKDGLFEIKNGTKIAIPYDGPKVFRAIEVNNKGVAHFCGKNGIYIADKQNHNLTEIASIKNIFGLTFNSNDNIIYSNPHEIVKLLPHDCKKEVVLNLVSNFV